jgi:hypothetical protein
VLWRARCCRAPHPPTLAAEELSASLEEEAAALRATDEKAVHLECTVVDLKRTIADGEAAMAPLLSQIRDLQTKVADEEGATAPAWPSSSAPWRRRRRCTPRGRRS